MFGAAMSAFGSPTDLALLGVASGMLSLTLTRSPLFKYFRHKWITVPIWGELINCPFCMSFWTSLLFIDLTPQWLIQLLVIWSFACLFIGVMLKLWLLREQELEDMHVLLREAHAALKAKWEKTYEDGEA